MTGVRTRAHLHCRDGRSAHVVFEFAADPEVDRV
jgi:hypothetical protein